MGNGTENMHAYERQRERLQGMRLTGSGNNIMESKSKMELTASFQLVENVLNTFCQVTFLRNNHV